jgi:hypothetical protein
LAPEEHTREARRALACAVALLAAATSAGAAELRAVDPSDCVPLGSDFTLMWWADGWRGRSAGGRRLRMVRTGRYAFALDVESMTIPHLGRVRSPLGYAEAAAEANAPVLALPAAELAMTISVGGKTYACVGGGPPKRHSGPRLIDGGRFVQRADVTDLVFEAPGGERLNVDARFETVAWPDRLALILEARPGREAIPAGDTFGRVGGGWGFDGESHIDVPHSDELEPEQLTLAMWAFVPPDYKATRSWPWLACKNRNEWHDGNYGLMIVDGSPRATVCIGGGRANAHVVDLPRGRRGAFKLGAWHHLAMTYDGRDLALYVDGRRQGSKRVGRPRTRGKDGLAFGKRQDKGGHNYRFRGVLDEIRLWKRALPAAEVARLAKSPKKAPPRAGLVREWLFNTKGRAAEGVPLAEWRDAKMELSLEAGGRTFADAFALRPGEAWTTGVARTVAVAFHPGSARPRSAEASAVRVTARAITGGKPRAVTFDPARGWHAVDIDRVPTQGEANDRVERVRVRVENPGHSVAAARLLFEKPKGGFSPTGVSLVIRDEQGVPTGLPVQISKNWHSQNGLAIPYQGTWLHGFGLLRVPGRSAVEFELTVAYAHWGGVAAASHAQLCLIGWGSNQQWDESALGSWGESICYEPDRAQAKAGVLDVRPLMVWQMKSDTPRKWGWTNNVGGGDFFRLFDSGGERVWPERMKTAYLRHGPCLTEVVYAGRLAGGAVEHSSTVSLGRTDDVVRGIYRLRMDVRRAVDFSRFVIFQIGADTYSYTGERKHALGNEGGLTREWATRWGGDAYRTQPAKCEGSAPWVSLHEAVSRDESKLGAWANRGVVLREWRARLGGRDARPWMAEYGAKVGRRDTSLADFVPPPGCKRLEPGDYVEATFEHVVMPQFARDYYGPNANLKAALGDWENTWRMVHREAAGNDLDVKATVGEVVRRRPTLVRCEGGRAEISVTGGLGYVPLTFDGLSRRPVPVLETRAAGGEWRAVDQSVHGHDFWQTDYDPAGRTWSVTYTVPLDSPGDKRLTREFRFRAR